MKKAVIVLPTYNESKNVEVLVENIFDNVKKTSNWEMHILVVDSNSNDGTPQAVKKLQKTHKNLHLMETKKEGLGKAYIHGFTYTLEKLNPYLIFEMDADLQHDPKKIPDFLAKIEQGADFVLGTRYVKGGSIPSNWGAHRKILSVLGNLIIRLLFMKPQITDWTGGYRAIKSWIVKESIPYIQNQTGYVFQIALLDFALKKNARIAEVPIHFKDRTYGESKINFTQTILQTLYYVFTKSSFVRFVIVGGFGFILDFSIAYFLIEVLHKPLWFATLISTETAIISNFLLNNFWSFSHKQIEGSKRSYLWGFLKFNLVSSGSIGIQTLGIHVLDLMFGRKYWYIYKILLIIFIVIPYSYFFYNKVIWKDKKHG